VVAETDLSVLLKNLNPVASSEDYVFTTLPADSLTSTLISVAKGMFQEREGTTLILPAYSLFSKKHQLVPWLSNIGHHSKLSLPKR